MRGLLARAVTTAPSEAAALLLLDPAGRELVFRASRTIQPGMIDGMRLPTDRGIAGWVARHRQAVRLDDVASDPRHFSAVGEQTGLAPRTMICVPMISKGTLRGVIQVLNKVDGSTFTEAELSLAQTLADHAAIAIENASLYRQAYLASITDDLTGLGNTRHFHQSLAEVMARGRPVSLVVLDLDNFKAVVDRYGHLAGSRSIAQIGRIDRPAGATGRRGGTLRRGRVRDRAAGYGRDARVPSSRNLSARRSRRASGSKARMSISRASRPASVLRPSPCTPPTRRASSARPTPRCTRPSARGRTGSRWPRLRPAPADRRRCAPQPLSRRRPALSRETARQGELASRRRPPAFATAPRWRCLDRMSTTLAVMKPGA